MKNVKLSVKIFHLRFLGLATWYGVASLGSEGPALLTALTLNWYFVPLVRPVAE